MIDQFLQLICVLFILTPFLSCSSFDVIFSFSNFFFDNFVVNF